MDELRAELEFRINFTNKVSGWEGYKEEKGLAAVAKAYTSLKIECYIEVLNLIEHYQK